MSGGIKQSGTTGKLLLARDNSLKTCTCCDEVPFTCDYVLRADACFEVFAEGTCEKLLLPWIWICADATCDGDPIPLDTPITLFVYYAELDDYFCYTTDPTSYRPRAKLDETDVVDDRMAWDCTTNCTDPECGTAPYNCDCVCYNFATDPDEWCCNGTKDTDGHLYWDWTYAAYTEKSVDWSTRRLIVLTCPTNIIIGCNANQACTWYRSERRHVNPEGYDLHNNECCITKTTEQRVVLDQSGDTCGFPSVFPGCCYCPDTADNVWNGEGPVELCGGSNVGFIYSAGHYYGPTPFDGCVSEAFYNNTYYGLCELTQEDYYDETYSYFVDSCELPDNCCFCQQHEVQYTHGDTDFIVPFANDAGCTQCFNALFPDLGLLSEYGPLDELLYLNNDSSRSNSPQPRGKAFPNTITKQFHDSQIGNRRISYNASTQEVVFAV